MNDEWLKECIDRAGAKLNELRDGFLVPCPFTNYTYCNVPGYQDGYGCPVCGGISIHGHVPVDAARLRKAWTDLNL